MGMWSITIEGVGQHHNDSPNDADVMAEVFVEHLRKSGQHIDRAQITFGGRQEVGAIANDGEDSEQPDR